MYCGVKHIGLEYSCVVCVRVNTLFFSVVLCVVKVLHTVDFRLVID